jgi:hypothetical protein
MTLTTSVNDIFDLVQDLGLAAVDQQMLIIGSVTSDTNKIESTNVVQLGQVASASDIDGKLRVDLVVVADQIEHMTRESGTHLLSRLRDLVGRRVLLIVRGDAWAADELLALGYQQVSLLQAEQNEERPSIDGRYFLHDPKRFHEPREWNNSSDWANPQNFNKYRW